MAVRKTVLFGICESPAQAGESVSCLLSVGFATDDLSALDTTAGVTDLGESRLRGGV
jgi:hypothetical protein